MAAAVSSMENGVRLSYRASQEQRQQQQQHQHQPSARGTAAAAPREAASGRPLQPRLFSSRTSGSRLTSSPFGGRSLLPSAAGILPSAARVGSSSSPSFSLGTRSNNNNSSSISTRSNGSNSNSNSNSSNGGGGFWASIVSFGVAALPAFPLSSLSATPVAGGTPSPASSSSTPRRGAAARRNASSVVSPETGAATATATRTRRSLSSLSPPSSSSLSEAGVSSAAAAAAVGGGGGGGGAVVQHSRIGVVSGRAGVGAVAAAGATAQNAGNAANAGTGAGERVRVPPLLIGSAPSASGGAVNGTNNPSVSGVGVEVAGAVVAAAPAAAVSGSVDGTSKTSSAKKVYLEGGNTVYTCSTCRAHLATRDHVISECFHGHRGRAFLFERCVNVVAGRPEDRRLMTGMHVVADICCKSCGAELGWKYEEAVEKSQKYKVGKFILERFAVTVEGRSGDGCCFGSSSSSRDRPGFDRCGNRGGSRNRTSVIGWGADNNAPFAESARW